MPIDLSALLNGSALFGNGQEDPNKAAMSALAAQLLMGSGYSPQRTSLGQQLGAGLQAGISAKSDAIQNAQKNEFMKAQIQAMLSRQQENQNHVIGNALVDDTGRVVYQGSALDNTFGRVNPGDYTPESLEKFAETGHWKDLVRAWAPVNPTVQQIAGVPTVVQPSRTGGLPTQAPLSTLPNEISAAEQRKQAEAAAAALGGAQGDIQGTIQKKGSEAVTGGNILDIAEPLIDVATGSAVGSSRDKVAAFFGQATDGAQAIGKLQVLQAALMMNQPRMEGPQGEKDVELYQKAAGQIGDPSVPGPIKKAAMQTIRQLQEKYKERAGVAPRAPVGGPAVGTIEDGYRFKGGDPSKPENWERAR